MKVSRNGICGTDLHEYYDGPIFIPPADPHPLTGKHMPLVIGHEFSGAVTAVGHRVTDVQEGENVTIEPIYRCGHCRPCKSGLYHLCTVIGFHGLMATVAWRVLWCPWLQVRLPGHRGLSWRWWGRCRWPTTRLSSGTSAGRAAH